MSEIVVIVLCEGRIVRSEKAILEAHSSVTMVTWPEHIMIVDTSDGEYRPRLIDALSANEVDPDQVDIVVNTHLHSDHCSNNDLFRYAVQMAHENEAPDRQFVPVPADLELYPGISLVHTPGHTPGTMSVFVEAERKYAIVGDAIPTFENVRRWIPPGIVFDREVALRSMKKIVDFADVVIPGHDTPFEVDRRNDRFIQNRA
ncbi:MAG: MBL fold metallo-hydrolase [Methanomassiliicoccales archaeon]|jgi:glyoxylase-like metal-dependent hydrolase (beta-lactamase superfamily II)